MKANYKPPKVWRGLSEEKKAELQGFMTDIVFESVQNEQADLQIKWMKLCCILLHDAFGFGEQRLLQFLANWKRIYKINAKCKTEEKQAEWFAVEMKKCFPKTGFPDDFIESLKDIE